MTGCVVPRRPGARAAALAVALLCGALVAGCIDEPELDVPPAAPEAPAEDFERDGRDLRTDLREDDEVGAPAWGVGHWFGVHVFLEEDDFQDDWHFDVVVVEDGGDAWRTATPDEAVAKEHAMIDYPGLGDVSKENLGFTGFGVSWDWMYDFPLRHEKTWTRDVEVVNFTGAPETASVTFTATYASAIETMGGDPPGFQIVGVFDDGSTFIEYDFVPAIGWFGNMWMYEGSEDPVVHVVSMGYGTDWTGTYYVYEGELLLEHLQTLFVFPPVVEAEPDPYNAIPVAEDADFVSGFLFAGAFGGAQTMLLVEPDGSYHEVVVASEPDPGGQPPFLFTFSGHFEFFEYDGKPGDWHLAALGGGVVSFSVMMLWQLWKSEHTL